MYQILLIVQVCICITLIGFILLQQGKGADMGAALGGGASQTLFGSTGSANFLSRTTAILAVLFFLTSLGLNYVANVQAKAQNTIFIPKKLEGETGESSEKTSVPESDVPQVMAPEQQTEKKQ